MRNLHVSSTISHFLVWFGDFSQERQGLWLSKDDLQDSSSWSSSSFLLLRDIHSKFLSDYRCKEDCVPSQSQVNVGSSGRLSSQDGVSQQQESPPPSIPQIQWHDSQERMGTGSTRTTSFSVSLDSILSGSFSRSVKHQCVSHSGLHSTRQVSVVTTISGTPQSFNGHTTTSYKTWLQDVRVSFCFCHPFRRGWRKLRWKIPGRETSPHELFVVVQNRGQLFKVVVTLSFFCILLFVRRPRKHPDFFLMTYGDWTWTRGGKGTNDTHT
jgi:hypothetical protein